MLLTISRQLYRKQPFSDFPLSGTIVANLFHNTCVLFLLLNFTPKDRMAKLVEIHERLEGSFRLVQSTRDFIKEGKLKSVSAKTGKKLDRYVFLVS